MRHSLLVRMLGLSLAVAVCSIAATAWLTTRETTQRIQGEFDRTLDADGYVYRGLLDYAMTNDSWEDVGATVDDLAETTGRGVVLTTPEGEVIAESADHASASLPPNPAAEIDPLGTRAHVSAEPADVVVNGSFARSVDGQAAAVPLSPEWGFTDAELARRAALFDEATACLQKVSATAPPEGGDETSQLDGTTVMLETTGGAAFWTTPLVRSTTADPCIPSELSQPSAAALEVAGQQSELFAACLDSVGIDHSVTQVGGAAVTIVDGEAAPATDDLSVGSAGGGSARGGGSLDPETAGQIAACETSASRTAFDPYLADAALLYLDSSDRLDAFSSAGWSRTALTGLGVLAAATGITVLAGRRLVRPIRALTEAAQRMATGERTARVPVKGNDDVARLGHAFNAMAQSVEAGERQRQAMVSDVAHELRTPLANVRGYLEAAQDGVVALDPELVASLLEESALLQRLVDDLQDLALADAGRLRMHPEDCDLADLARQVVAAHRSRATEAGVDVRLEDVAPALVRADPARVRQALGNLVGNAIQYTQAGGTVTVRTADEGEQAVVTVADTGPGISADALPHVFDRFYRVDGSRSRDSGGSGLGLAITRQLIELHGGAVEATSVDGEGSTFTIRLPADPAVASDRSPAAHASRA